MHATTSHFCFLTDMAHGWGAPFFTKPWDNLKIFFSQDGTWN